MYRILTDGLLHPKNLLAYRNKSGLFVFAFFAVLAFFATIGTALFFLRYAAESDFRPDNVACTYAQDALVCDASQATAEPLDFFGSDAYFLPSDVDAGSLPLATGTAVVFQDEFVAFFSEGDALLVLDLSRPIFGADSVAGVMSGATALFLVAAIVGSLLGNILLIASFALMSSLSLLRLRGFLRFGKAYTVLAFATVPFALVLTFHNLLGFPEWVLIILLALAFRSPMIAIREIFVSAYGYMNPPSSGEPQADDGTEEAGDESQPRDDGDDAHDDGDDDRS